MQYTLLCNFGVYFNDDTPSNTLLYFYSTFKKDEKEEINRKKNQQVKSQRGPSARVVRSR